MFLIAGALLSLVGVKLPSLVSAGGRQKLEAPPRSVPCPERRKLWRAPSALTSPQAGRPGSTTLPMPSPLPARPAGPIGICIALVSAGLAAANLLLDMAFVSQAARSRAVPAALEWYCAQNLLFELVWLYTSILQIVLMLAGGRGGD
jgi:hypothetical protein